MRIAILCVFLLMTAPAFADKADQDDSTDDAIVVKSPIVIGPDAVWKLSDACSAPAPLSDNSDPEALSSNQASRQKFMDCVRKETSQGDAAPRRDLDQSLAAIADGQSTILYPVHKNVRAALVRLDLSGYSQ